MKAIQAMEEPAKLQLQSKNAVIHFEEGLIGFSDYKDFMLLENDGIAPFRLLQAVGSSEVGFLALDPLLVMPNYYDSVPQREWDSIRLDQTPPLAFVIVIIGATPETSTGNFQAPLLINYRRMIGKQVILSAPALSVRQPLV